MFRDKITKRFGLKPLLRRRLNAGCGATREGDVLLDINPSCVPKDKGVVGDVAHLPFKTKSFDEVICFDVIEHLPKKNGLKAIRELERVAQHVRLKVPNAWQISGRLGRSNLPLGHPDRHNSVWTVAEFKAMGYNVKGFGFRQSHTPRHYVYKFIPQLLPVFNALERSFLLSKVVPELSDGFYASKETCERCSL